MKFSRLLMAGMIGLLAASASAQTSHYVYFVGGVSLNPDAAVDAVLDGAAMTILVADVDSTARTVTNWRRANYNTGGSPIAVLPSDNPNTVGTTENYGWFYTERTVNIYNGFLFVGPAGSNSTAESAELVISTRLYADGSLSPDWNWSPPTAGDHTLGGPSVITEVGGVPYLYVISGGSADPRPSTVEYIQIDPATGGFVGTWQTATATLPEGDWFNRAAAYNGRIYHQSGNLRTPAGRYVDTMIPAAGGNITSFTSTADFGAGVRLWDNGIAVAVAPNNTPYLVIAGGSNGSTADTVYTAAIDPISGALSAPTLTNPLPAVRRRMTLVATGDMIIQPGGSNASASAGTQTTVYIGQIDNAGAVTWTTSPVPMGQGLGAGGTDQGRAFTGAAITPIPSTPTAVQDWTNY